MDATIDADSVILWFDKKKMGRVLLHWGSPLVRCMRKGRTMRRKDDVQIADKIFENAKDGKGILINNR